MLRPHVSKNSELQPLQQTAWEAKLPPFSHGSWTVRSWWIIFAPTFNSGPIETTKYVPQANHIECLSLAASSFSEPTIYTAIHLMPSPFPLWSFLTSLSAFESLSNASNSGWDLSPFHTHLLYSKHWINCLFLFSYLQSQVLWSGKIIYNSCRHIDCDLELAHACTKCSHPTWCPQTPGSVISSLSDISVLIVLCSCYWLIPGASSSVLHYRNQ
jgi:hypothetical protein